MSSFGPQLACSPGVWRLITDLRKEEGRSKFEEREILGGIGEWVGGGGDRRKLDRAWVGPWVVYPKAKRAVPYDGPI